MLYNFFILFIFSYTYVSSIYSSLISKPYVYNLSNFIANFSRERRASSIDWLFFSSVSLLIHRWFYLFLTPNGCNHQIIPLFSTLNISPTLIIIPKSSIIKSGAFSDFK